MRVTSNSRLDSLIWELVLLSCVRVLLCLIDFWYCFPFWRVGLDLICWWLGILEYFVCIVSLGLLCWFD